MKVKFLTPLSVERISPSEGEPGWKVTKPFEVEVDSLTIVVPQGFFTDFASVPRLPLAYYLAGGRGIKASVIHDYLYETGLKPKDVADNVFLAGLLEEGEPHEVAYAMYAAVSLAGGSHYKKEAKPLEVPTIETPIDGLPHI